MRGAGGAEGVQTTARMDSRGNYKNVYVYHDKLMFNEGGFLIKYVGSMPGY